MFDRRLAGPASSSGLCPTRQQTATAWFLPPRARHPSRIWNARHGHPWQPCLAGAMEYGVQSRQVGGRVGDGVQAASGRVAPRRSAGPPVVLGLGLHTQSLDLRILVSDSLWWVILPASSTAGTAPLVGQCSPFVAPSSNPSTLTLDPLDDTFQPRPTLIAVILHFLAAWMSLEAAPSTPWRSQPRPSGWPTVGPYATGSRRRRPPSFEPCWNGVVLTVWETEARVKMV